MIFFSNESSGMFSKYGKETIEKFPILKRKNAILKGEVYNTVTPVFNNEENESSKIVTRANLLSKMKSFKIIKRKEMRKSHVNYFPNYSSIWKKTCPNIIFRKSNRTNESPQLHTSVVEKGNEVKTKSEMSTLLTNPSFPTFKHITSSTNSVLKPSNSAASITDKLSQQQNSNKNLASKSKIFQLYGNQQQPACQNELQSTKSSLSHKLAFNDKTPVHLFNNLDYSFISKKTQPELTQSKFGATRNNQIFNPQVIKHKIKGFEIRKDRKKEVLPFEHLTNNYNPNFNFVKEGIVGSVKFHKMVGRDITDSSAEHVLASSLFYNTDKSYKYLSKKNYVPDLGRESTTFAFEKLGVTSARIFQSYYISRSNDFGAENTKAKEKIDLDESQHEEKPAVRRKEVYQNSQLYYNPRKQLNNKFDVEGVMNKLSKQQSHILEKEKKFRQLSLHFKKFKEFYSKNIDFYSTIS